ncbi:neutral zinc metallopeptidase [Actinokineospora auranticolor]|nr:neutral zinc metallopeptidase [Actinokineospora auranticolor]
MPVAPPPMAQPLPPAPGPYGPQGMYFGSAQHPRQYGQYGPPPGYAPVWAPPMRPKSNTGMIVAITLSVILLAATGVVSLNVLLHKPKRSHDVGYSAPSTSYTPPSTTTTTTTTVVVTTTTAPRASTSTTTTGTRQATTTTAPRTTATASRPQPVYATVNNPLFMGNNSTTTVTCNLPAWRNDPSSAHAFFAAAIPCFDKAWAPVMQRANLPYISPKLESPTGKQWSSPCGSESDGVVAAFYCSQNNTLYMPYEGLQADEGYGVGNYLALFAHEFGHHIQAMSGVTEAYWNARYEAGDQTAAGLELSRRSELQASCFGGMWLAAGARGGGSINKGLVDVAIQDGYHRGDWQEGVPRDHGSPDHNGGWQEQGYTKNLTYQCNTWNIGPEAVS